MGSYSLLIGGKLGREITKFETLEADLTKCVEVSRKEQERKNDSI